MGLLYIGIYFLKENFDKMVVFCIKLVFNW